ncbi:hypothetical protein DACRYDRAFT_75853 [Dacryopinax primogenitus]|uniref:PLP-dependent transferase n=1 Tax=Dacryopinax primogenitus (strain DJM 731) TaxID=1858805 RepID=M5G9F9_DACPD|nr:uncharacterized protein DACRYDRAFT_75853 [Dacryopinax primogenitus]EJU04875.1 hypothetical protein DACRYDRAFT_75853 [Dacryopinax primogenitus]
MALLFRNLRAHIVFGANTDVGKTILTTLLCRAAAQRTQAGDRVHYLKPVSTGPIEEADDEHVKRFAGGHGNISTACLYRYDDPVSPHLAAQRSHTIPTDVQLADSIRRDLTSFASNHTGEAWAFLETAGSPLSPSPSSSLQATALRPLRLPVVLVADPHLGGIGTTLSAYESLVIRGWSILGVVGWKESKWGNLEFLRRWFERETASGGEQVGVWELEAPPPRLEDKSEDARSMEGYYSSLSSSVQPLLSSLDERHQSRLSELDSMDARTRNSVWWPFTQHGQVREKEVMTIDSASGDFYSVYRSSSTSPQTPTDPSLLQQVYDGSASWWTQSLGHAHPSLALAAANAAARYGHVIFPSSTHAPALELAERLLRGEGEGWADRVFWSDDGSTGVEVALKMATRAVQLRMLQAASSTPTTIDNKSKDLGKELGVIGLKGSYHGDTIGAMDASEPSDYSLAVPWYRGRGFWFSPPAVSLQRSSAVITIPAIDPESPSKQEKVEHFASLQEIYDVPSRLSSPLAGHYRTEIERTLRRCVEQGQKFGALLLEPLLMGAGGMIFVDPLFQRVLADVVRSGSSYLGTSLPPTSASSNSNSNSSADSSAEYQPWTGLPVIHDSVFVGLSRLGCSPRHILQSNPDIAVYGKMLTGGLVPMSVTLSSSSIFSAFLGDKTQDALLHGHSYTAHPVGCSVANRALVLMEGVKRSPEWGGAQRAWGEQEGKRGIWSLWELDTLMRISELPCVERTMAMGTVLAITLQLPGSGYATVGGKRFLDFLRESWVEPGFDGVHSRALGRTVYFMSSLNTPGDTLRFIERALEKTLGAWGPVVNGETREEVE